MWGAISALSDAAAAAASAAGSAAAAAASYVPGLGLEETEEAKRK